MDRRIAQVVAIIGRDRARVEEIEQQIRSLDAKNYFDTALRSWPPYPVNKRDKTIARSVWLALAKLEKQLDREFGGGALDQAVVLERAIYGERNEFFEWRRQLERWRDRFQTFAGEAKVGGGLLDLPTTKSWPLGRPKPSVASFRRKDDAVAAAAAILKSHGVPLTATRRSSIKASVFCRVAAVLFGDPRASLYHQCRAFLTKARNRVSK